MSKQPLSSLSAIPLKGLAARPEPIPEPEGTGRGVSPAPETAPTTPKRTRGTTERPFSVPGSSADFSAPAHRGSEKRAHGAIDASYTGASA